MDPTEILKGDLEETVDKVQAALKNLKAFKSQYEEHNHKLKDYFNEKEPLEWEFTPELVFHRYDKFMDRVEMIYVSYFLVDATTTWCYL